MSLFEGQKDPESPLDALLEVLREDLRAEHAAIVDLNGFFHASLNFPFSYETCKRSVETGPHWQTEAGSGIGFFAVQPVKSFSGEVIGGVCVAGEKRRAFSRARGLRLQRVSRLASALLAERAEKISPASLERGRLVLLGQLSGMIAHEIKNPLAVVSGLSQALSLECKLNSLDPRTLTETIYKIDLASKRVANIVSGLSSLCRGESTEKKRIAISKILDEAFELGKIRGITKKISLVRDPSDGCLEVLGCEIQISQALLNLVFNAIDAAEGSSPENRWVRFGCREHQSYAEFWVEDSGPAIDAKLRDRLMEPYFTTKDEGKGTGLGLYIAKKVAEDHGGFLTLDLGSPTTRFVLAVPKAA